MFDKIEYWKNRKAGKRGQGPVPRTVTNVVFSEPTHLVTIGTRSQVVNRRTARSMGEHREKQDVRGH